MSIQDELTRHQAKQFIFQTYLLQLDETIHVLDEAKEIIDEYRKRTANSQKISVGHVIDYGHRLAYSSYKPLFTDIPENFVEPSGYLHPYPKIIQMVKSNLYSEQLSDVELELQKQYQTQIHKLFDSAVTSINQPTNSESETSEDLSVTKNQQATVSSELSLPIISQKLTSSPVAQTEKSTEQTLSMRLAAVANSMRMQMKDELGDESEGEEEEETNEIGE